MVALERLLALSEQRAVDPAHGVQVDVLDDRLRAQGGEPRRASSRLLSRSVASRSTRSASRSLKLSDAMSGCRSWSSAVCSTRRIWLASAERQLVRSEASWLLCSLIRFSACPRAQCSVS